MFFPEGSKGSASHNKHLSNALKCLGVVLFSVLLGFIFKSTKSLTRNKWQLHSAGIKPLDKKCCSDMKGKFKRQHQILRHLWKSFLFFQSFRARQWVHAELAQCLLTRVGQLAVGTARLLETPHCCGQPAEFTAETHPKEGFLLQITRQKCAKASNTCQLPEDGAALPLSIILPVLGDICSAQDCLLIMLSKRLWYRACFHAMVLPSSTKHCGVFAFVAAVELGWAKMSAQTEIKWLLRNFFITILCK